MELRQLWGVVKRRWLLMLLPAVVVLVLGLLTYRPSPPIFNTGVRFIVGQPPAEATDSLDEQRYYNWLTSEYIVNGLTDWVRGGEFAQLVSDYLATQALGVPPEAIQGAISADNARSMLTLSMTNGDPTLLGHMMDGVIVVLMEQNAAAMPQLGGISAEIVQLDQPVVNPIPSGFRSQLDLPFRIALALAVGLGLALLVEYLDPTIRDRDEASQLDLPLLGEIPKN